MKFFLAIVFLFAAALNTFSLRDGHNWGDDFAQYLINARNIIEAKPFNQGIMLDNPTVYPPGYAFILVPIASIFGFSFIAFKALNVIFWFLALLLLYALFSRMGSRRGAAAGVVFLALSSNLFLYKQNILSDIPFFFASCAILYCAHHYFDHKVGGENKLVYFLLFVLSLSAALWLRSAGVIAFVAALIYLVVVQRNLKAAGIVLLVLVLNEWFLSLWMGVQPGFLFEIAHKPADFFKSALLNFSVPFRALWCFVCPPQTIFSSPVYHIGDAVIKLICPVVYVVYSGHCAYRIFRRDISYLELFSFLYLSFFIFWAGFPMPPDAFVRFVLPLIPFMFLCAIRLWTYSAGRQPGAAPVLRIVFVILLVLNVTNIAFLWKFNDDVLHFPANSGLIQWVRENTKPDDKFMFWKPRALAFLTRREGTAPWISSRGEDFDKRIKDLNITYVILFKGSDDYISQHMERVLKSDLVWQNGGYRIYKV